LKRYLWALAPLLITACAPMQSNRLTEWLVAKTPLAARPDMSELLQPPPEPLVHSLIYPTLDDADLTDQLAPAVVYSADVDLTAAADPALWQIQEPPLPYAGDVKVVVEKRAQRLIDYYTGPGHKVMALWLERAGRYMPMMQRIFAEEGLPRDLAYLALCESGFNEKAASWAHAVGPWQFIESTGRRYGLSNTWWRDERRDPEKSTRAAARYLKSLLRQFDGDVPLAVAAYNAGPGKIRRAMAKYHSHDYWQLCRGKYLQNETKNYVPKLMAVLHIVRDLSGHGFTDLDPQTPLKFDRVEVDTTTDLEVAAEFCGVDYDELKELNPELKRWCTPPKAEHYTLRVPAGTGSAFAGEYAQTPPERLANYLRHRIVRGDTLLALAKRYKVRVKDIVSLNGLDNPRLLTVGRDLILPLSRNYSHRPVEELADDYIHSHRAIYTVRGGDSLWSISRRFGVTERQLRVWNRLGWSNVLRPGQRLMVSARSASHRRSARAASTKRARQKVEYRVQAGDTLWGIGRQFQVTTAAIRSWNNLNKDHVLRPGDRLTLYVSDDSRS